MNATILLLSTYDLGRQPFGLASPAAWLKREGVEVHTVDLSRTKLDASLVARATLIGFYLPMHTATRLALPVIDRVRDLNPRAVIAAFGLYAPLNESLLRERGVALVLGPEFEQDLVAAARTTPGVETPLGRGLPRLAFIKPDRHGLPGPERYAMLRMPDGSRRVAGATDATRGCKHRCRHCPIVPVYDGTFRVVPIDVVMADVRAQIERGVQHITFGDPDFFNGPTHASRLVDALHAEWPSLTYDVTIKVEHLLAHRDLLPRLADTGCLFVTSAVESVDDAVLARLEKGHTRADFVEVVRVSREAGLVLTPTFVAFTPWTTPAGYLDLLDTIERLDLVEHVSPVQWSIRLLVTEGSRLLELPDLRERLERFDPLTLTYPWAHDDQRVDGLQQRVMKSVGVRATRSRRETFDEVRAMALEVVEPREDRQTPLPASPPRLARAAIPYLDEPWYC